MILNAFERLVAFRYLRAKRDEGFISVIAWFSLLGICLGVATLIIVMAVMNGFRHELLSKILGLNGHVTVSSHDGQLLDYDALATKIRLVDGVISVTPMIEGQVMTSSNGLASGAIVRGITAKDFMTRDTLKNALIDGDISNFNGGNAIFIGKRFASKMRLSIGDDLRLISPNGTVTAFGSLPRMKAYKIVGIFEVGMYEYDSSYIYMPLQQAQIYFKYPKAVSSLEVILTDPDEARMRLYMIRDHIGKSYSLMDWPAMNSSFFNALQVERNVMFLILTLIIIVAAFNIISSQIMLVNDKARGVAIMRTMGAKRITIMKIFFVTGSSVGVIGTALGATLGISFALNIESIRKWIEGFSGTELFQAEIYFLSKLPARIEMMEVISVILMALALSLVASIYPAWRAAKLDPVEVLRYE